MRTALLLAVALILGAGPASALADGPGVKLYTKGVQQPIVLPGGLFAGGVSMLTLISKAKVNLNAIKTVTVVRQSGDLLVFRPSTLGAGIISDDGNTTTVKLSASSTGANVVRATAADGPIEIAIDGGADLAVKATASPSHVAAGKTVFFKARIRGGPTGADYSYSWDFGDGSTDTYSGEQVSHVYKDAADVQVQVSVTNLDSSCSAGCSGVGLVDVRVGAPPHQPTSELPTPGAATGSPNGAGSSTGTGGGGQGGSGGDSGAGTGSQPAPAPKPAPKPAVKPPPPPPKPFGTTISGVLLDDIGRPVRNLPKGKPAGAPKGARAIRGGGDDDPRSLQLAAGGLLALLVVSVGALRERRGVRLRTA
jgi:hypothetical protein